MVGPLHFASEEQGEDMSPLMGSPAFPFSDPLKHLQECIDVIVHIQFGKQSQGITGWISEGDRGCAW